MSELRPDTVLQRVPDLRLDLRSDNSVLLFVDGRAVEAGARAMRILEAFAAPAAVGEVVRGLGGEAAGAHDWLDLTSTIFQLHAQGVLVDPASSPHRFQWSAMSGFDSSQIHAAMLNDHRRTSRFLEAVERAVAPGAVVVDLGSGTGILAVAAARAGASRVYAIEACGIADTAREVIDANGVADRVTLIRDSSLHVRLPERAGVLVSEIIGNEPLGEMVLESMRDAVQRFLADGGRVVPEAMSVFALPVEVPPAVREANAVTPEVVGRWRERYGVDFGPLLDVARRSPQVMYREPGWMGLAGWPRLAEPVPLLSVRFGELAETMIDATVRFRAARPGRFDGLLIHFELDLGDGIRFSTHPDETDASCSWRYPVWLLGEPLDAAAGDGFEIRYQHAVAGAQNRLRVQRTPEPAG